ncbi:MAG: F0F1 ATP synthase subunit B' [Alphaproteobacteria bacterium]
MPQLALEDFAPQLVWLAITFAVLYLAMWKLALPRIAGILEGREERINSDLTRAEKLKAEAEKVLAAYEKAMADARGEAEAMLRKTSEKLTADSAARHGELTKRLAERAKAAEARIDEAKAAAVATIGSVAAEAAVVATAKLIGVEVDESKVAAAVDAAASKEGRP